VFTRGDRWTDRSRRSVVLCECTSERSARHIAPIIAPTVASCKQTCDRSRRRSPCLNTLLWLALRHGLMGNESVPKITINNTVNLFLKIAINILVIQTITVSESVWQNCFCIFYLKNIFLIILASQGNQHCASCIGTLSFHITNPDLVVYSRSSVDQWASSAMTTQRLQGVVHAAARA